MSQFIRIYMNLYPCIVHVFLIKLVIIFKIDGRGFRENSTFFFKGKGILISVNVGH